MLMVKEGNLHPFDICTLAGLHWKTTGSTEERRRAFREHWSAVKDLSLLFISSATDDASFTA